MAEKATLIRSNKTMTAAPLLAEIAPGQPSYRDSFTGDTTSIVGRITEAEPGDGLMRGVWEGTPDAFAITSGKLVRGTNAATAFAGINTGSQRVEISILVTTAPTGGGAIYLDIFRSTIAGSPDSYRLRIQGTAGQLMKRIGGLLTSIGPAFTVSPGDRIGVRWVGGYLIALRNRAPVAKLQLNEVATIGYSGLAMGGAVTGFQLDDLEIDLF